MSADAKICPTRGKILPCKGKTHGYRLFRGKNYELSRVGMMGGRDLLNRSGKAEGPRLIKLFQYIKSGTGFRN